MSFRHPLRWILLHLTPALVDEAGKKLLRDQARAHLMAGVRPTLGEWNRLSTLEQEAYLRAGEDLLKLQLGPATAPQDAAPQSMSHSDLMNRASELLRAGR